MSTAKDDVAALLNRLPDDCTIEDIQYHLFVLDKLRRSLEAERLGQTVSHEDVEAGLDQWLAE